MTIWGDEFVKCLNSFDGIIERYKQEIPYSVEVVVNSFKEKEKVFDPKKVYSKTANPTKL